MEQIAHHECKGSDPVKVSVIYLQWLISFRCIDTFRHLSMFLHCLSEQSEEILLLVILLQDRKYRLDRLRMYLYVCLQDTSFLDGNA